jgi:ribosomal protein L24E
MDAEAQKFREQLERAREQCMFCKKKGTITYQGTWKFCGKEHLALYKEKTKLAKQDLAKVKVCATCGKLIKGKGLFLIGPYARARFKVYKFCNGKCFDNMPDFEHPDSK